MDSAGEAAVGEIASNLPVQGKHTHADFSFNAGKNHSTSLHLQYAITLPTDQYEVCRQIMN